MPTEVDLLLEHCHIACMDEGYGIIEQGFVAIKGERIVGFGNMEEGHAFTSAHCVNLKGLWLTPGLIDCHTHIVYAGNRASEFEQRLEGQSYADIAKQGGGILSTVAATRAANAETLLDIAEQRIQKWQNQGVTAIEIKSGYGLDLENELKMLQVIQRLKADQMLDVKATFLAAHALPKEYRGRSDAYIDQVCNVMLPKVKQENLADSVDAFCEHIGFNPAQVKRVFSSAQELGFKLKLHADQLSNLEGGHLAATYDALSADHLEYVSEQSLSAMKRTNTVAVLLPGAYYFLGEKQLPPIDLMRAHGISMAVATDCNPGSSPCTSLLLMMNFACTLFGLRPVEALAGVTKVAARALSLVDQGIIKNNAIANLALWEIEHPRDLSYAIGDNPCCARIYRGQLIWR